LRVGFGGNDVEPEHHVGTGKLARRFEVPAIELHRLHHVGRGEVRGEGEGQAEVSGKFCAEEARSQEPDGYPQAYAGIGANTLIRCCRFEIGLQLFDVLREIVGSGSNVAAQCAHGGLVRTGSAAEAEIDAAWKERGERAELLRDDERRMIREHDAARADADGLGAAGDVPDDDGSGGAGDARHVVVFGEPEAVVAPGFRVSREIERVAQSVGGCRPLRNRRKIENGEGNHSWLDA